MPSSVAGPAARCLPTEVKSWGTMGDINKTSVMRVLITGMGGQLGTKVAQLLEARSDVESIVGYDIDPPRRRLSRSKFTRLNPRDQERVAEIVAAADPTVVVHLGVYEPHARLGPVAARTASAEGTRALVAALDASSNVASMVLRSGIEVYGRRRGGPHRPDEDVAPLPTSGFGVSLLDAEQVAAAYGATAQIPVAALRFAPLVGAHFPSPLGRFLKLAAVPFNGLADPPFTVVHAADAAISILAAIDRTPDGPLNIVGPGAITAAQAARVGRRLPLPLIGPAWRLAKIGGELMSAPLPDHVHELLVRGRVADGTRATAVLGIAPVHSTPEIIVGLYEQSEVEFLQVDDEAVA